MHSYRNILGLAGLGAALAATPALASVQDEAAAPPAHAGMESPAPEQASPPPTPAQLAEVETWPADKQQAYKGWTAAVQNYFWTLTPERRAMFWRLNDADRETLTKLTEPQREMAWAQIKSKLEAMQS
ncbi:MAG: hypothetical protein ACK4E5_02795 [Erythrobacter cryptus]